MSDVVGVILMPNAANLRYEFLHNVSFTSSGYDDRWMSIMQIAGYADVNYGVATAGWTLRCRRSHSTMAPSTSIITTSTARKSISARG